ncbi:MAG: hypothetical protein EOO47_26125 [Flavobacterium sp.]|nr:MAG: hypothetical protein EOO47_26125 [Flavobacterium sp.]
MSPSSLLTRFFVVFTIVVFSSVKGFSQKIAVQDLTVEHLVNPFSVDNSQPRFSWKTQSDIKNTLQTNYEIRVGKNETISKSTVWSSDKKSDQSVLVTYAGPDLESKTKYYWQVRVKDNHGNTSKWSQVQWFQTGLKEKDWIANWITIEGKDTSAASPMFRKEFNIRKKIKTATAYITAKGLYEARLNGQRISNHYFAPGWTSYQDHLQYQVYDLTNSLKTGLNAFGVSLGNGWLLDKEKFLLCTI